MREHPLPGLKLGQLWLLSFHAPALLVTGLGWWESHHHGTVMILLHLHSEFSPRSSKDFVLP